MPEHHAAAITGDRLPQDRRAARLSPAGRSAIDQQLSANAPREL